MPHFQYKAVTADGETIEGEMEAANQAAVVERLQAAGHLPIHAQASKKNKAGSILQRDLFARRRASRADITNLTRELATLIQAGLPIDGALEILIELTEDAAPHALLEEILADLKGGASFSDCLAARDGVFPPYYISMVRAGEAGGTLNVVLARLSEFMERAQATRETIRSAMIYPAILVGMAVLAVVVLLTVVVPRFRPMFEDAGKSLPFSTQIVVALGDGFQAYWWLMLIVLFAIVTGLRWQLRRPAFRLRWDRVMLKVPIFGDLIIKADVARFARTLGTLVGNGVSLLDALTLAGSTLGNKALAHELIAVSDAVRQGRPLTDPLIQSGMFPKLALHLTRVGEETGQLHQMLLKIAEIYDEEVQRAIDRMLALLVPVLTIVLGLLIAGIIGSILAAILSVYQLPY